MEYLVYGPFGVVRNRALVSRRKEDIRKFWESVEEAEEGLSHACGCYVFVIRGRAWYIGLAERQSFKQECFALHKITQYNEALQRVSGNSFSHASSETHARESIFEAIFAGLLRHSNA